MPRLVLFESSLTKVSDRFEGKELEEIRRSYKKYFGRFFDLLDWSALPPSIRPRLGEKEGRPDIVHRSLLAVTDHPAFLDGILEVFIHTLNGRVFRLAQGVRPPRNYRRFLGLMEQLLERGWVGKKRESPLIYEVNKRLMELVGDAAILLDETGDLVEPLGWLRSLRKSGMLERVTFLVGCYPEGRPAEEVQQLAREKISLYEGVLTSSTSVSMILTYLYYVEVWGAEKEEKEA